MLTKTVQTLHIFNFFFQISVTQELCQLVVNELNSISKYALRIYERTSDSGNVRLREFLNDNITSTCRNLQSITTHSQMTPNTNIPNNDSNYSLPPESMTQAMALLQQYSDRLLNIVEQKMSKKE